MSQIISLLSKDFQQGTPPRNTKDSNKYIIYSSTDLPYLDFNFPLRRASSFFLALSWVYLWSSAESRLVHQLRWHQKLFFFWKSFAHRHVPQRCAQIIIVLGNCITKPKMFPVQGLPWRVREMRAIQRTSCLRWRRWCVVRRQKSGGLSCCSVQGDPSFVSKCHFGL